MASKDNIYSQILTKINSGEKIKVAVEISESALRKGIQRQMSNVEKESMGFVSFSNRRLVTVLIESGAMTSTYEIYLADYKPRVFLLGEDDAATANQKLFPLLGDSEG